MRVTFDRGVPRERKPEHPRRQSATFGRYFDCMTRRIRTESAKRIDRSQTIGPPIEGSREKRAKNQYQSANFLKTITLKTRKKRPAMDLHQSSHHSKSEEGPPPNNLPPLYVENNVSPFYAADRESQFFTPISHRM